MNMLGTYAAWENGENVSDYDVQVCAGLLDRFYLYLYIYLFLSIVLLLEWHPTLCLRAKDTALHTARHTHNNVYTISPTLSPSLSLSLLVVLL